MKKRLLALLLVVVMAVAFAVPAMAGNDKVTNVYLEGDEIHQDFNNAQFHCNCMGGNGRVWPVIPADMKKFDGTLTFTKGKGTTWILTGVADKKGNELDMVVCPECGSTQWVTFSNNSGVPDGKNVQMNHPLVDIEIVKVWLDAEGNVIKDTKGLSAKFGLDYLIGDNDGYKVVGPGKISVPAGDYTVEELIDVLSKNFTLIRVESDSFTIDGVTGKITITPEMALAGGKYTITFTNKEDPHAIIIKEWADGNPEKIIALFDIFEEDGETLVKEDVKANEKVYVAPGTYIVREHLKPGYIAQEEQTITVGENKVGTCTFVNEPVTYDGTLAFIKTVDGEFIADWELNGKTIFDVIDDISFGLFKAIVDADGDPIDYDADKLIATGELGLDGNIMITYTDEPNPLDGWYAVVEFFTPGSLAEEIFEDVGPVFVFYVNGVASGISNFDYDATFWGLPAGPGQRAGHTFTFKDGVEYNPWFDDFHVQICSDGVTPDGKLYSSFCADWNSGMLGRYMWDFSDVRFAGEKGAEVKANIIKAFNYINNQGDLELYPNNKFVAQLVLWKLLDDGIDEIWAEGNGDEFDAIVNARIAEVLDFVANGKFADNVPQYIVDIVFLAQEGYAVGHEEYLNYQPQVVAVFATFDNKTAGYDGTLTLTKTVDGTLIADWELDGVTIADVIDDISFKLFKAIVDADGDPIDYDASEVIATGELGLNGEIELKYDEPLNGWYAVVEFFTPGSLAEELFEDVGPLYVYFVDGTAVGGGAFDFDSTYKVEGWIGDYGWYRYTLGYWVEDDGSIVLNQSGEIFPITVTDEDGNAYVSFCANAGSSSFGSGYMQAVPIDETREGYLETLAALNYIYTNYGAFDKVALSRQLAQIFVWHLFCGVDFEKMMTGYGWLGENTLTDDMRDAAREVLENYKGAKGDIISLAYLIDVEGEKVGQPQLVPIFDNITFDNKTTGEYDGKIVIEVEIDAIEEFIVQTHTDDYRKNGASGSLTSSKDDMPFGISDWYNTGDNELFYKVDIEALKAAGPDGLLVWIAERDGHDVNASLGYYYILSIDEAGRPIVTMADDNVISWGSLNVNGFHANNKPAFGNNGSRPSLTKIDDRATYALDGWVSNSSAQIFAINEADEAAGYFWFHVHMNQVVTYALDANGERVPFCVLVGNSPVQTRAYDGDVLIEVSLDGGVTKMEYMSLEFLELLDVDFPDGTDVTVTVYVNGVFFGEQTLTVIANDTIYFMFTGSFTVNAGNPIKIVDCDKDYCPGWIG